MSFRAKYLNSAFRRLRTRGRDIFTGASITIFIFILAIANCGPKPASNTEVSKHYRNGISMMERHDFEGALKTFRKALKSNPDHAPSLRAAALCFKNIGEMDSAVTYFEGAIVNNPKDIESYIYIGDIYYEKKDFHEAMTYYDRALEIGPISADAYMRQGNIYYGWREYERARAHYSKAVETDSSLHMAKLMLGLCLLTQTDTLGAVKWLNLAYAQGRMAKAAFTLGMISYNQGNLSESKTWMENYLEIEPGGQFADRAANILKAIDMKEAPGH